AFDEKQAEYNALSLELDHKKAELADARGALAALVARRTELDDQLKKLQTDSERLTKAITTIAPTDKFQQFKRWLMLQPIVDGFNSPHRIRQEWLPDLPIIYGMATTARFDQCRTCHVNIADFAAGNVPAYPHGDQTDLVANTFAHPFSSHPHPDVYVSETSPHPLPTFGCTICHDGDGSGTGFQTAEHTPDNPAEAERWAKEHHWHSNHFWEYPMQPDRFIESTCIKCHHTVTELGVNEKYGATAPKVFEGYTLIREYGCYGCHEISGFDGDKSIGPDLRLEPNVIAAALQLLEDPAVKEVAADSHPSDGADLGLLGQVDAAQQRATLPFGSMDERVAFLADLGELSRAVIVEASVLGRRLAADAAIEGDRAQLTSFLTAAGKLADVERQQRLLLPEDLRTANPPIKQMTPQALALADSLKSDLHPGRERKVGPSLRHLASKTTPEFVAYWTELPSRFRPDTRMPQFFHLSNQEDELAEKYQPVQLAAIAAFLQAKSQPLDLMRPAEGYQPNAERGKVLFSRRCLACHTHEDAAFEGIRQDFGPNLTKVHEKIKPGEDGFQWMYTWINDPMRHHPRTKMPDFFLDPEGEGDNYVDPAADIAAFLLGGGPRAFPQLTVNDAVLDELVELFARKSLTEAKYRQMIEQQAYPLPADAIKGDEIELARRAGDPEQISDETWRERKVQYVGRKTITFYGCYGCHDIPEFETARPIGTALQDWGRKDTSRLALEHIEEFLHHHGAGGDGAGGHGTDQSLPERLAHVVENEVNNPGQESADDLSAAFFYESLQHHGRPGFLWQKLREPRSYDYKKTETKGYDERLRMPKFPFNERQIESIATFVLGLVAEPPPEKYQFRPEGPQADTLEGERLLAKYNCIGCHIVELPEIKYGVNPDDLVESTLGAGDFQEALDLLLQLKPPRQGLTGEQTPAGDKVVSFHGLIFAEPDFEEDPEFQEYSFDLWETLQVGEKLLFPGSKMLVPAAKMIEQQPARGGTFAQWLVPRLMTSQTQGNRALAWQASPPPLHDEGQKVQTPWLFRFLKNPHQIRYTPVLRMPRFNLSDDEAQSLANYFAAADRVPYPYQSIPQQQQPYLKAASAAHRQEFPNAEDGYLEAGWKVVNVGGQQALCRKCHAVGGHPYQSTDPVKDIRGPNLDIASERLRPDWLLLWISNPPWITPYTSMPVNFTRNQQKLPELFGGDGQKQSVAARDALLNYVDLLEAHGKIVYEPAGQPVDAQTGAGGQ
ncbi:MAG: c-type cytochrome, partial [Planctomycetaceae bacterium]